MLCETCRFSARPGYVRERDADPVRLIPCPDCGGSGIAHCCDGICEQPASDAATAATPPSGTTRAP